MTGHFHVKGQTVRRVCENCFNGHDRPCDESYVGAGNCTCRCTNEVETGVGPAAQAFLRLPETEAEVSNLRASLNEVVERIDRGLLTLAKQVATHVELDVPTCPGRAPAPSRCVLGRRCRCPFFFPFVSSSAFLLGVDLRSSENQCTRNIRVNACPCLLDGTRSRAFPRGASA